MSLTTSRLPPEQRATLILWQRVNTSLSAFYKLIKHYETAQIALKKSASDWEALGIHAKHIIRHTEANDEADDAFIKSIEGQIDSGSYNLLFLNEQAYPSQLKQLFDPPPVLFYRGNLTRLTQAQIAIVGSRKPSNQAQKFTFDMAQYLAKAGYVITSGLAQGVDAQAHLGALAQHSEQSGRTIGVMGTGIDVCYPKQHKGLFDRIINEGGCIISEILPGTPPNKHTFPRRNRIVAGLSLGTIVTEAALQSGSLITARLTSEQGKQIFAIPSTIDNVNAEGCLHLIREGATLIYHPDQVLNDLSNQMLTPIQRQAILQSVQVEIDPDATTESGFISIDQKQTNSRTKKSSQASKNQSSKSRTSENSQFINRHSIPSKQVKVPSHLQSLWMHMDYRAQDLDGLILKTQLETASLLSQLMELELMGLILQIGGRYQRL